MPISQNENGLLNQEGQSPDWKASRPSARFELIPSITVSETGKRVSALSPAQLNADPSLWIPAACKSTAKISILV